MFPGNVAVDSDQYILDASQVAPSGISSIPTAEIRGSAANSLSEVETIGTIRLAA